MMEKRILACILSFAMAFSLMPMTFASAEESNYAAQIETQEENVQNGGVNENETTITFGSDDYTIRKGGAYSLAGGNYQTHSIVIETTEDVTLNILGDITAKTINAFIYGGQNTAINLTINGNGHTIKINSALLCAYSKQANVVINGGTYLGNDYPFVIIGNFGTMTVNYGTFEKTTGSAAIFGNSGTLNINEIGGDTIICGNSQESPIVSSGTVNMCGGTIKNSLYAIELSLSKGSAKIGDSATFSDNTADIRLSTGTVFTIENNFKGQVSVSVSDTVNTNAKRQITATGTSKTMLSRVTSVNSDYSVKYDENGKYLYLLKSHSWKYSASKNVITAKCSDKNCEYYSEGLTATLTATDTAYTGDVRYKGASLNNNITGITDDQADSIYYVGRDDTQYTKNVVAPTYPGTYTAEVTIGGVTAKDDFTIVKADINLSVSLENWVYGENSNTPMVSGNTGTAEVTYAYKEKAAENSTYKKVTVDELRNLPVGQYTLKATVKESANYNGASATCDFTVAKHAITVVTAMDNWVYGNQAKTPTVIVKAEGKDITSSYEKLQMTYTYYTDSECNHKTTSENGAASDGAVPKNAGTYYVKIDVEATENYSDGSAVVSFTIEKRKIGINWIGKEFIYNGSAQQPTAAATNLVEGDSCTITVSGSRTNANVGEDTYKATAVGVSNSNYILPEDGKIFRFAICPKKLTNAMVTLDYDKFEYSKNEQGPSIGVKDGVASLVKDTDYEVSGDISKSALGNYTVTITGKGNYTGTVDKVWKICKRLITDDSITKYNYSGIYDGQPHSAVVEVNNPADTAITYSKREDGTYSAEAPEYTSVGSYTVYYKIEKEGYETATGTLTVTINAGDVHDIKVIADEKGSASSLAATAGYGTEVTLTATPYAGFRFKEWKVVSGGSITITNNRFVMPNEDVEIQAVFELIPSSSGGTGNTPSQSETKEDYTILVKNEDTLQVDASITDGKAEVSDITKDMLDSVMNNSNKESEVDTITIDLSGAKQTVTSVSLSKTSIKTLSDAVSDKSNGIDSVTIELTNATVTLDAKTLQTLDEQAKGSQIELVVEDTKKESLNVEQEKALAEHQVATTFEIYFVSEGERIHDFNGGSAVVAVRFAPEAGRNVNFYHIVYVDENGKLTYHKTRYTMGKLEFTTSHFSDYAVVYDENEKNDTDADNFGENETVKVDSSYAALRLRVTKSTKTSNVLKWIKYTGADGYVVYGNFCNTKTKSYSFVKLATVGCDKTTYIHKNLLKGTYYKYYVKAYKVVDGKKVWLATSKVVHATTSGSKYGNAKAVSVNKTTFTLSVGKSAMIKAKQIKEKLPIKYHTNIKYESTDKSVATVSKTGVIKAKKKGIAYIYVYAQNGINKRVKVTVK